MASRLVVGYCSWTRDVVLTALLHPSIVLPPKLMERVLSFRLPNPIDGYYSPTC